MNTKTCRMIISPANAKYRIRTYKSFLTDTLAMCSNTIMGTWRKRGNQYDSTAPLHQILSISELLLRPNQYDLQYWDYFHLCTGKVYYETSCLVGIAG